MADPADAWISGAKQVGLRSDAPPFPRLVYIKPPKTASISVAQAIKAHLAREGFRAVHLPEILRTGRTDTPPNVAMLHGHVSWHQCAHWIGRAEGWKPIFTLRDPLDRVRSHYRYLRERALRESMPDSQRPLCEEALTRPLRDLVRDETSGFFGWTMPVQSIMLGAPIPGVITEHSWPEEIRDSALQARALECALERLEQLWWIGIVDTLDRDLETLALRQGWPLASAPRRNQTRIGDETDVAFSEIDAATRRLLTDRLAADYLLLEAAREIAAEQHRAAIAAGLGAPAGAAAGA